MVMAILEGLIWLVIFFGRTPQKEGDSLPNNYLIYIPILSKEINGFLMFPVRMKRGRIWLFNEKTRPIGFYICMHLLNLVNGHD
jgi:hypothetical protein